MYQFCQSDNYLGIKRVIYNNSYTHQGIREKEEKSVYIYIYIYKSFVNSTHGAASRTSLFPSHFAF